MKLCLVILGGATDEPSEALGGRTPLEAARLPALRALAAAGRSGAARTVPKGARPSVEAAVGALFGFAASPPAGGLMASALGIPVPAGHVPWRCDLVNLFGGRLFDATSGDLRDEEARLILASLDAAFASEGVRFIPGAGWRTLLFLPEATRAAETAPPASIIGDEVAQHLPRGPGSEPLRVLMERAPAILADHDVNVVRADHGENPASDIWIWGGGVVPAVRALGPGTAFGGHPSFRGAAKAAGLDPAPAGASPAAAGGFSVVFVETPLRAGRAGDAAAKVAALEEADRDVVAPLAEALVAKGEGRLLLLASHGVSSARRRDLAEPVPFVLAGPGTSRYGDMPFTEEGARQADLKVENAGELLEFARRS